MSVYRTTGRSFGFPQASPRDEGVVKRQKDGIDE